MQAAATACGATAGCDAPTQTVASTTEKIENVAAVLYKSVMPTPSCVLSRCGRVQEQARLLRMLFDHRNSHLVNPRLVRESVGPDDGLVGLHHHSRHGRHQLGRLDDLLGLDVGQSGLRQHGAVEGRVVVRLSGKIRAWCNAVQCGATKQPDDVRVTMRDYTSGYRYSSHTGQHGVAERRVVRPDGEHVWGDGMTRCGAMPIKNDLMRDKADSGRRPFRD